MSCNNCIYFVSLLRKLSENVQISLIFIRNEINFKFFSSHEFALSRYLFYTVLKHRFFLYCTYNVLLAHFELNINFCVFLSTGRYGVIGIHVRSSKIDRQPPTYYNHPPEFYILFFYEIIIQSESNTSELKSFSIIIRP